MPNHKKILIVQARFYPEISDMLLSGTTIELDNNNFSYDIIDVPGVFEVPATIAMASKSNQYSGFIALGCVIRGETSHYDYVCQESARGLNDLAINKNLAIGYGIITTENLNQAIVRSDKNKKNKGQLAAKACVKMIEIRNNFIN